jgi:urease accessory protein
VLRQTPDALCVVGGAAGPLGGDELELDVNVGCHADLRVHSAAAMLAQPGPRGQSSGTRIRLCVGEGGSLTWIPEPLVSVRGSTHVVDARVELAPDARLCLVEELVLGRWGEPSGRVTSLLRVARGGAPLLAHDLDLGGDAVGWSSAAAAGDARAVRTELHVGAEAGVARTYRDGSARAAAFPVAADVTLVVALGLTLTAARLAAGAVGLRPTRPPSRTGE